MGQLCGRCGDCLLQLRPREGEQPEDRTRRRLAAPVFMWLSCMGFFAILFRLGSKSPSDMAQDDPTWMGGVVCGVLAPALGLALLLLSSLPPSSVIGATCIVFTVGLLAVDLANASRLALRVWPLTVMVLDFTLVFDISTAAQCTCLFTVVIYLAAVYLEDGLKYGLYHAGQKSDAVEICLCPQPPCAIPVAWAFAGAGMAIIVMCTDFVLTRGFARKMRQQLDLVAATVRVSEEVTQLLADYSTEEARQLVAREGATLPEALRDSYGHLLANLDRYRAFLPDSLHMGAHRTSQAGHHAELLHVRPGDKPLADPVPAPGARQAHPEVAVCFTDVQGSTVLWDDHPQDMYEALHMHNALLRKVCDAHRGYEVKTIGDSFMVAFADSAAGLGFALTAQKALLALHWPEGMLSHPLCSKVPGGDGEALWGGLRVRIGIHYGPVRVQQDPVTKRIDYFGTTVNVAARLEGMLRQGGFVVTSDTVMDAAKGALPALGSPVARDLGLRDVRGIKSNLDVWVLVPRDLAGRLAAAPELQQGAPPSLCTAPGSAAGVPSGAVGTDFSYSLRHGSPSSSECPVSADQCSFGALPGLRSTQTSPVSNISLRLQQSHASCATVRAVLMHAQPVQDRAVSFAAAVALTADRTQGTVDSVLSACAAVSWNAWHLCVDHAGACRHFLGGSFRTPCHLGAASGGVLSGNVPAGRRSFATVIGGCVELAAALAEEAELCGDRALATGAVAEHGIALGAAYWAQIWKTRGGGSRVVCVMDTAAVRDKWQLSSCDDDAEPDGGGALQAPVDGAEEQLSALFYKACAGGPGSEEQDQVLMQLRLSGAARSPLAEHLSARIEAGAVRTRITPELWDAADIGSPAPVATVDQFLSRSPPCRDSLLQG